MSKFPSLIAAIQIALALAASGCISAQPKIDPNQKLDIARLLKQVNDAVATSIDPNDKTFPPISSISLDLQVTVGTSIDAIGKPPLPLVAATVSAEKDNVHHINLTFIPSNDRQPATQSASLTSPSLDSPLAGAIRAVYASVSRIDGSYKFRNGSITLQCVLKKDAGLGVSLLGLVPLQFDAKHSDDLVQSLTLNFGVDPRTPGTFSGSQHVRNNDNDFATAAP